MSPQTVSPPPKICPKCGWPLGYEPNHIRYLCNPTGGKAVDDVVARLTGVTTATKLGYGQDTLTVILENGATFVLDVSKEGRFSFKTLHLINDYGASQVEEIIGLFAKMSVVK
jgi:hypothetical protein